MLKIKDITEVKELEAIVQEKCPEHETWKMIVGIEKQTHETGVIAQYILDDKNECVGLMQYYYHEGTLFRKTEIEISLLTLFTKQTEYIQELHRMFVTQYPKAKRLIQVLEKEDLGSEMERLFLKSGFKKYVNGTTPRYGYTAGSAYYVMKCDKNMVRPKSKYEL